MPLTSTWPTEWPAAAGDIPTEAEQMQAIYGAIIERLHVAGISHPISACGVPDRGLVRRAGWYAEMSEAIALLLPHFVDTEVDYATLGWDKWPRMLSETGAALQVGFPTGLLPSQGSAAVGFRGWLAKAKAILDRMHVTRPIEAISIPCNTSSTLNGWRTTIPESIAASIAAATQDVYNPPHPNGYPVAGMRLWDFGYFWDRYYTSDMLFNGMAYRHTRSISAELSVVAYMGYWFDPGDWALGTVFDACGTGLVHGLNNYGIVGASSGLVIVIDGTPTAPDVIPTLLPLSPYEGHDPVHGTALRVGYQANLCLDYAFTEGFKYYTP